MSFTPLNVEDPEYAFLGLEKKDVENIENPLTDLSQENADNLHLHILRIMKDPKYFHWTVKKLLNIDLLPVQTCVLRELWKRSFPMYLASRGFGKSFLLAVYCVLKATFIPGSKIVIVGAAFRQSKVIFEYMDTIWRNAPLLWVMAVRFVVLEPILL